MGESRLTCKKAPEGQRKGEISPPFREEEKNRGGRKDHCPKRNAVASIGTRRGRKGFRKSEKKKKSPT